MPWIVEDHDNRIGNGRTPMALYNERRHDPESGKLSDDAGTITLLGLCVDEDANWPATRFKTKKAAQDAIDRTNEWFEEDCGNALFQECTVREVRDWCVKLACDE